jgi:hypothetical protein
MHRTVSRPVSRPASARLAALVCLAALLCIASSCSSDGTPPVGFCTAPASLSVIVTVRDSISGQAAADGSLGTLVGASVDDTLHQTDSLTLLGGDQAGTFTVRIDRPGYLTWTASDVHVTEVGPCGNVIPVELSAKLQPGTS